MVNTDLQREQFQGRLKRIKKGAPNTLGHVYVGSAEDPGNVKPARGHFGIFKTLVALIVGLAAYFVGGLGQYHMLSDAGTYPVERLGETGAMVAATGGDLIFAALTMLVLFKFIRMRSFASILVGTIGIFLMMGAQSFVIGAAPEFYASLYSEDYVAQVLHTQEAQAFY